MNDLTGSRVGYSNQNAGLASQTISIWEKYNRVSAYKTNNQHVTAQEYLDTEKKKSEAKDTASISSTAYQRAQEKTGSSPAGSIEEKSTPAAKAAEDENTNPSPETSEQEGLSENEEKQVRELKETDRKVHAHEQAHMLAGGDLVRGGAQYAYEIGPDKKRYAVSGEVSIDTSPVEGDPEATIIKAGRIKKTALAPADPSPQDRSVAAAADAMAMRARMELARMNAENQTKAGQLINVTA